MNSDFNMRLERRKLIVSLQNKTQDYSEKKLRELEGLSIPKLVSLLVLMEIVE